MKKTIIIIAAVVALAAAIGLTLAYRTAYNEYEGAEPVRIYIPAGSTAADIRDVLTSQLGADFGGDVATLYRLRKGDPARTVGSYVISPGDRAWSVNNRLRTGTQTPVKVTFNNIRNFDQLAGRIADRFSWSAADFAAAADTVLPEFGFKGRAEFPAAFIPDSYEFFWTTPADQVVRRLATHRGDFWTQARRDKAARLGLTPVQVATVASIVEEETAKADERGRVARLYLNRLDRGMKLQADPTVKFALGDFSLRRIGGAMLDTESPYNTYRVNGLPPGPIRVPERSSLEAVLEAPQHNYLYMCAKSDFSGYHDFAADFDTHRANARAYQTELNRRGIH